MPRNGVMRNAACPCGSGVKFKKCHGRGPNSQIVPELKRMLDATENPVRWVITNQSGTAFFSDKQNRVLVFSDRETARQIALLDMFTDSGPNDIYISPLGAAAWRAVQEKMPFLEVANLQTGVALVEERVAHQRAERGYEDAAENF